MRSSNFKVLFWAQVFLLFFDFFMTPNPYLSGHGGFGILFAPYFISITSVTCASLALVMHQAFKKVKKFDALLLIALLMVGLIQAFVFGYLFQIFYEYIVFSFLYLLSKKTEAEGLIFDGVEKNILFALFVLGFFLAFLKPNTWGLLNFSFNRSLRSEISFNDLLGLTWVIPAILVAAFQRNKIYMVSFMILMAIEASFGYRRYVLFMFCVLLIYVFTIKKYRYLFMGALFLTGWIYFGEIRSILIPESQSDISTGRFLLWGYFYNCFYSHPFLGVGPKPEIPNYFLAHSEAGVSFDLAKFGLPLSLFLLFHLGRSVINSFVLIFNPDKNPSITWVAFFILGCTPMYLTDSLSRPDAIVGTVFWFGVFFMSRANSWIKT